MAGLRTLRTAQKLFLAAARLVEKQRSLLRAVIAMGCTPKKPSPSPHQARRFSRKVREWAFSRNSSDSASKRDSSCDSGANNNNGAVSERGGPDCKPAGLPCCRAVPFKESREVARCSVSEDDLHRGQTIGNGGFGTVYEGRYGGKRVAVKVLDRCRHNLPAAAQSLKAELCVLDLRHPNIVRTLAVSSSTLKDNTFIVMEHAGEKNLQQVISDPEEPLYIRRRLRFALDISKALDYSHKHNIAHLDLKPANVMVTGDDRCKVGDFGCCQVVDGETGRVSPTERSHLTGTFAYRAPELMRGDPPTTRADIYSYGITLWQMRSREHPYLGENPHVVIFGVVANNVRPAFPEKDEEESSVLEGWYQRHASRCWNAQPNNRPSATEVVEVLEEKLFALRPSRTDSISL
ncbi:serine/threonine-protein kinase mos-like [Branchiostoma lanceolatum]|uniref:serine/threonine-protein kinase mos-like n=1 Tax=Branchiostoma lanceolatum TaxID=7740 RepID=UPI003454DAF2